MRPGYRAPRGRFYRGQCAKVLEFAQRCYACGRPIFTELGVGRVADPTGQKATCDHVIPVSQGGTDDADNLVPACTKCNGSRQDRTIAEWLGARPSPAWAVSGWPAINAGAGVHTSRNW